MPLYVFTESLIGIPSLTVYSKALLGLSILNLLEQYKVIDATHIYNVSLRLTPRAIRSPAINITSYIYEPLRTYASIDKPKTPEELLILLRDHFDLEDILKREEAITRGLEIEFDFITKLLDVPSSGTLLVRGTGPLRKYHGDLELDISISQTKLKDFSASLKTIVEERGNYKVYDEFRNLSEWLFKPRFTIRGIAKRIHIRVSKVVLGSMDAVFNVKERFLSAHRSIRGFVADIVNSIFLAKGKQLSILAKEPKDPELRLLWHLYHISRKVISPYFEKKKFLEASLKAFREEGYNVSKGSFIVVTVDGSTIERGYKRYLERVLIPFVSPIPGYDLFRSYIEQGFRLIEATLK